MPKFIEPGRNFPHERVLPDHWAEPLRAIQEHELEHRWTPSAKHPERDYKTWAHNHPAEAKTWVDTELVRIRAEREASLADWILTRNIASRIELKNPTKFRDPNLNGVYGQLHYVGLRYRVAPDAALPELHAVVAEARRAASSEPKQALDTLRDRLNKVDPAVRAEFADIAGKLNDLGRSLEAWSKALKADPTPDAATLTKIADECLQRFQAVQDGAIDFKPKKAVAGPDLAFVKVVVREFVETMAGVVGDQLAARLGEPSFLNMFNRLSEQPHGEEVDPAVKSALNAKSGNYRSVWNTERDNLLKAITDKGERANLEKALQSNRLDLGPNFDKWKSEFGKLSTGKYDPKVMKDAILKLTFAADSYLATINTTVTDQVTKDSFKKLIDGLILSIGKDVQFCVQVVK